MPKPPKTPPSSDLDGVHEDQLDRADSADAAGSNVADLERARRLSKARPPHVDTEGETEEGGD